MSTAPTDTEAAEYNMWSHQHPLVFETRMTTSFSEMPQSPPHRFTFSAAVQITPNIKSQSDSTPIVFPFNSPPPLLPTLSTPPGLEVRQNLNLFYDPLSVNQKSHSAGSRRNSANSSSQSSALSFDDEEQKLWEELEKTKPEGRGTPPKDYVCHSCFYGVPEVMKKLGRHYVEDCTYKILRRETKAKTPYQGTKVASGVFNCPHPPCGHRWESDETYANTSQTCPKCNMEVFPKKQWVKKQQQSPPVVALRPVSLPQSRSCPITPPPPPQPPILERDTESAPTPSYNVPINSVRGNSWSANDCDMTPFF